MMKNEKRKVWWDQKLSSCIGTTHSGEEDRVNIREDRRKRNIHKKHERENF